MADEKNLALEGLKDWNFNLDQLPAQIKDVAKQLYTNLIVAPMAMTAGQVARLTQEAVGEKNEWYDPQWWNKKVQQEVFDKYGYRAETEPGLAVAPALNENNPAMRVMNAPVEIALKAKKFAESKGMQGVGPSSEDLGEMLGSAPVMAAGFMTKPKKAPLFPEMYQRGAFSDLASRNEMLPLSAKNARYPDIEAITKMRPLDVPPEMLQKEPLFKYPTFFFDQIMDWPEIFELSPELRNRTVTFYDHTAPSTLKQYGGFVDNNNRMFINLESIRSGRLTLPQIFQHETQHIHGRELGWPEGAHVDQQVVAPALDGPETYLADYLYRAYTGDWKNTGTTAKTSHEWLSEKVKDWSKMYKRDPKTLEKVRSWFRDLDDEILSDPMKYGDTLWYASKGKSLSNTEYHHTWGEVYARAAEQGLSLEDMYHKDPLEGVRQVPEDYNDIIVLKGRKIPARIIGMAESGAKESPKGWVNKTAEEMLNQKTTKPRTIMYHTEDKGPKGGGYTVQMNTGEVPETGYMVGMKPNDQVTVLERKLREADIRGEVKRLEPDLNRPDVYFGTWRQDSTGKRYMEISKRFEKSEDNSLRKATKFGEETRQEALVDLETKEYLPIGQWKEFVTSDEFHQRMAEMKQIGEDYLKTHPSQDWWGTDAFTDVYGEQYRPQIAGYSGITSMGKAPTPNIQWMTELMRREIKGEPLYQPNWRIPAGTMTFTEGKKFPLLEKQEGNLKAAHEGRLQDIGTKTTGAKIRNMAQAMMGDENAAAFDRWWARFAEDPKKGVYTGVKEGAVPGGSYQFLLDQVKASADKAGVTVRDFAAQVWTGVKNMVETTKELYGQDFSKSATNDYRAFGDVFNELIDKKAKFLGISREKMVEGLRKGDLTLLSAIFSTAAGGAILDWYLDSLESRDELSDVR